MAGRRQKDRCERPSTTTIIYSAWVCLRRAYWSICSAKTTFRYFRYFLRNLRQTWQYPPVNYNQDNRIMTQKIPQFYIEWVNDRLAMTESSNLAYHKAKEYSYLIMSGPKSSPGNLLIFVFLNPTDKRKEPKFLKMHRIQASEVFADNYDILVGH